MFGRMKKTIENTPVITVTDPKVINLTPTACTGNIPGGCKEMDRVFSQDLEDFDVHGAETVLVRNIETCNALPGCLFGSVAVSQEAQNA